MDVRSDRDAGRQRDEVGRTEGRGYVDVGIAVHERVAGAPYYGRYVRKCGVRQREQMREGLPAAARWICAGRRSGSSRGASSPR
jgi:hypothetical protein